ncbi:SAM-dependent methyltransferase [beta proteobacterium AAP121]|nr:SAM-dependent methyltransferase [beta proteobacterium AAP65]KPF97245.1 SAM-dependent methyltransferase [beta proteobacterium AAP121]
MDASYEARRGEIEDYFDRTALKAWEQLTSNAPVGRIRATVRAGRDRMRSTLMGCLPQDLRGARVLDAGCGTGALALEAAARGAEVVAIDLSPALVNVARERMNTLLAAHPVAGRIEFRSGDMLDPQLGGFDHVVAMDSLIHYDEADMVRVIEAWSQRTRHSMLFTFAPRNPALAAMRAVGRLFPRGNRAPWIEPVAEKSLRTRLNRGVPQFKPARTQRISSGFYTSQALELVRG